MGEQGGGPGRGAFEGEGRSGDEGVVSRVRDPFLRTKSIKKGSGRMDREFASFETEMNRGFLQVLVLVALEKRMYGYGMINRLEGMGYKVEENTLYPLLRRLEKNGWIMSEWDVSEERPRKFYSITEAGKVVRGQALALWSKQAGILEKFKEDGCDE